MLTCLRLGVAALLAGIAPALPLRAADLTMAIETEPAIDPHFSFVTTNIAVSRHIYDSLTRRDESMQVVPGPRRILARARRAQLGVQSCGQACASTTALP